MNKKSTLVSRDTMTSDEGYVQWKSGKLLGDPPTSLSR